MIAALLMTRDERQCLEEQRKQEAFNRLPEADQDEIIRLRAETAQRIVEEVGEERGQQRIRHCALYVAGALVNVLAVVVLVQCGFWLGLFLDVAGVALIAAVEKFRLNRISACVLGFFQGVLLTVSFGHASLFYWVFLGLFGFIIGMIEEGLFRR